MSVPDGTPRVTLPDPLPGTAGSPARVAFNARQKEQRRLARGLAAFYFASGWAMYERHFVCWAESAGYALDMASNRDLHTLRGELLRGYVRLVCPCMFPD